MSSPTDLREKRAFLLRKLHSLSGVVPVGVFLVEHLWTNATALRGQAAYGRAVADLQNLPFFPVIEWGGVFLPLAFHAGFGVVLAWKGSPNLRGYPYPRNGAYVLQRVTGMVTLLFLLSHLWEFRIQKAFFGMAASDFYDVLSAHLSAVTFHFPWRALFYVVGLLASVYHFTNGLWGFCCSWGITVTRRAQRRAALLFTLLGAGLFFVGLETVFHFATGSTLVLPRVEDRAFYQIESPCLPAPSAQPAPPRTP